MLKRVTLKPKVFQPCPKRVKGIRKISGTFNHTNMLPLCARKIREDEIVKKVGEKGLKQNTWKKKGCKDKGEYCQKKKKVESWDGGMKWEKR